MEYDTVWSINKVCLGHVLTDKRARLNLKDRSVTAGSIVVINEEKECSLSVIKDDRLIY